MITANDIKGLLRHEKPESFFDCFDLDNPDLGKRPSSLSSEKLSVLSFSGPFELLSRKCGRLNVLKEIARHPAKISGGLLSEAEKTMNSMDRAFREGFYFDMAWMRSDLAHKDNLFFSIFFYEKYLFPIHKKMVNFLKTSGMEVIFHSDGKIDAILPYLIEAGIAGLYPMDEYCGMDMEHVKKLYGKRLVFFDAQGYD